MDGTSRNRLWTIAALLLGLYVVGFFVFVFTLPKAPAGSAHADGIVALTGGDSRLDVAEALLEQGAGKRLLISGVYAANTKQELKRIVHGGKRFDCCADLGFTAQSTRGNAAEAANWVRAHGYRSLLIVTANYHMPRSLHEFTSQMPEVRLVPYPVAEDDVDVEAWWTNPHAFHVLHTEYAKYLATLFFSALEWPKAAGGEHRRSSREA